jgi:hypothetical protein
MSSMDARPFLETLARLLEETGLEAILIGNAGAALQGAPVTTIDIDLLFRKTPRNIQKLKSVAKALDAVILRPYYPVSGLFRLSRDRDGMQIDFMTKIDGVKSFEALRARSHRAELGGHGLWVMNVRALTKRQEERRRLDQIRRLLSIPIEQRTNFLRRRVGFRASCL